MSRPADAEALELASVRAAIVADYATAWAQALVGEQAPAHPALPPRLAYLDLYGGPTRAAPAARRVLVAVAERAAGDDLLRNTLLLMLNDPGPEDPDARVALARELRPVRALSHPEQVLRRHPWLRIAARLEAIRPMGALVHWEPWGYNGLGGPELAQCMAIPQAEVMLSVRYPLLNMGLPNDHVAKHLDSFWGAERTRALRTAARGESPFGRQELIIAACVERLRELGAAHVLVFRLAANHRPSELLLHAARDEEAYARMKETLAAHSTGVQHGVPDYRYDPEATRYSSSLPVARPLDALADELARAYAGYTVVADELYRRRHVGTPYIRRNYADALDLLVARGRALRFGGRVRVVG